MSYRRKVRRRINKKKFILKLFPFMTILLISSFLIGTNFNKQEIYEQKIINMQQFSEKLSTSKDTELKTYYVSADGISKDGTDINNPMSLEEANKKTYYGNEKVLFKCGDIFYGTINFKVEASEEEMFYIGSYGEGEKPIISGANILINSIAWEKEENNIYKLDLSDYENFEGIKDKYGQSFNVGFIADEEGNIFGNRKETKEELQKQNDFFCEENYLYIKSNGNPSDILGKIKIACRYNLVNISSNTILDGLNIQYTGAHGISGNSDDLKNVYIHNCIIQNIGGSLVVLDSFSRYGNGIQFWNHAENTLVENCIIRNVYDAGYTVQGNTTDTGFVNNICRNNIFVNCTYDIEMFACNKNDLKSEPKLEGQVINNNISINQARGWGYDVRPVKLQSSILVLWKEQSLPQDANILMYSNKYFNFRNLFYKHDSDSILKEHYIESVHSDNNIMYLGEDSTLFCKIGNYEDRLILEEYNQDQNSTFRLLSDTEINQISNPEILNSNNYEEIKQYYENLEKEFKYTDIKNEIIGKYNEFSTTNQEVLSLVNELNTKLSTIKLDIESTTAKDITQAKLEELINNTYSMGTDVVTAFSKNIITKEELIELIKQINNLGQVFDEIYSIFNIENKSDKVTIISNVKMIEDNINNNSDLEISELIKLLEIGKEIQNKENTTYADYKYCTSLKNWTDDILKILIDQYIIDNPVSIKYSTKELTNKDVTATVETNAKIEITNNSNSKEYVFSKNGDFTFEYKIKGREFTIKATVTNIDKTNPRIDGIENGKVYETSVKPIITDENLSDVKLMFNEKEQDTYEINDTLSEEGYYKLTATDKAGNISEVVFYIMKDAENAYQIEGNKICNIVSNTKTENISQNLPIKEQYVIKRNDRQLEANEVVATGDVIELESGKKYTLIVKGDVNSDGAVNITDLVRTQNFILGRRTATEIEESAADANFDKEQITIKDLVRIQIMILNPPTT